MSDEKIWEKSWTFEEMIDNSSNWSLAGDVALLNTLKSFGNNLLTRINQIDTKLHQLTDNLDEANLQLKIAENKFQSLRNTQFIESRVYEDDETLLSTTNDNNNQSSETDHKPTVNDMKLAIGKGLQILDEYFDKVEVSVSDSEDETDFPNYILRPKDPYINRPLPYVIGSDEWYKKWHVGLEDSSSSSASGSEANEKVSEDEEVFSDSDNDLTEPNPNQEKINKSDNSSELEFKKSSDLRNNNNNTNLSDASEQNSMPSVQAPINNQKFAEQLAAKLGNVINNKFDESPEINKRPIIQNINNNNNRRVIIGDLFSDEPPPLDDNFGEQVTATTKKGLFSSEGGLFDDNSEEEEDLFAPKSIKKQTNPKKENFFDEKEIKATSKTIDKPKFKGIFDDDDKSEEDDDDIFTSFNKNLLTTVSNKPKFLSNLKPNPPLFDDEPPDLDEEIQPTKKKPTGGVSIFGKSDLFSNTKFDDLLKNQRKNLDNDDNSDDNHSLGIDNNSNDDKQSLQTDDKQRNNKKIVNIIKNNTDDNRMNKNDDNPVKESEGNVKKISLFDDDDDNLFTNDDLFKNISTTKRLSSNLFDDDSDLFTDDNKSSSVTGVKPKSSSNLFSDDDDDNFTKKLSSPIITAKVNKSKPIDLFDPTPPIDDNGDNWDTNSDIFDDNINYHQETNTIKSSSLFDNEPPPLDFESKNNLVIGKESSIKQSNILKVKKIDHNSDDNPIESFMEIVDDNKKIKLDSDIKSKSLLFDDNDPPDLPSESDDMIFGKQKVEENIPPSINTLKVDDNQSIIASSIDDDNPIDDNQRKIVSLFDDEPPLLIESNDSKIGFKTDIDEISDDKLLFKESDNRDDDDDNYKIKKTDKLKQTVSLFDDEPPSLTDDFNIGSDTKSSSIISKIEDNLFLSIDDKLTKLIDDNLFQSIDDKPNRLIDDKSNQRTDDDNLQKSIDDKPFQSIDDKPIQLDDDKPNQLNDNNLIKSIDNKPRFESTDDKSIQSIDNKNNTNKLKKTLSLFDDDDDNWDADDLFSNKNQTKIETPSPNLVSSPSKLKINLNINVNALLPGSVPIKKDSILNKSKSFDDDKSRKLNDDDDNNSSQIQILQSATKSRAKLPLNRRPSTRKGRQEALRKSLQGIKDDNRPKSEKSDDNPQLLKKSDDKQSEFDDKRQGFDGNPKNLGLFESKLFDFKPIDDNEIIKSRDDDKSMEFLFGDDDKRQKTMKKSIDENVGLFNTTDDNIINKLSNDDKLIGGLSIDDDNLFSSQKSSKLINESNYEKNVSNNDDKTKKISWLDDDDNSDDNLFSKKLIKKSVEKKPKKSLFGDDDDDNDDLFQTSTTNPSDKDNNRTTRKVGTGRKSSTTTTTRKIRKLENIQSDDDPLSDLLK